MLAQLKSRNSVPKYLECCSRDNDARGDSYHYSTPAFANSGIQSTLRVTLLIGRRGEAMVLLLPGVGELPG
jgi:hypothetical protein